MRAIILAAGSGLRLGQHTKDIPKALLDLNGKSILERQISLLRQHGINEIFVVTGYQREKHTLKDIEYIFNPRYAETEQLASMMVARTKISDDVLIIFGDIVFDEQILQQILVSNDDIGIAIDLDWEKSYNERPDNPKSLADKVLFYQKKIQQISAKITSLSMKNQQIGEFLGIMLLFPDQIKILLERYLALKKNHVGEFHNSSSLSNAYLTDMLQEMIDCGATVKPVFIEGKWFEIDTPEDLKNAEKLINKF